MESVPVFAIWVLRHDRSQKGCCTCLENVLLLQNREKPKPHPQTGLPIIRCKCGVEILLLPDLHAMDKAVETHVRSHGRKEKDPFKAAVEAEHVRDDLIKKIFQEIIRLE